MNIYLFKNYHRAGKRFVKAPKHNNDNINKFVHQPIIINTTCGEKRQVARDGTDRLIESVFISACGDE